MSWPSIFQVTSAHPSRPACASTAMTSTRPSDSSASGARTSIFISPAFANMTERASTRVISSAGEFGASAGVAPASSRVVPAS